MEQYAHVINGKRHEANEYFDVVNPSTGGLAGRAPAGGSKEIDHAVTSAKEAFKSWSKTSDEDRKAACLKIADIIEEHAEELAHLITREQGKPLSGAGSRFEIGGTLAWIRHTSNLSLPVEVLQDGPEGRIEVHRKPIGVVASITPWNWPVMIASWHFLPAIRTGNTVVLKPSPLTPLSTLRVAELANQVLPAGVLNVVTGLDHIGPHLTSHADVSKITFTGSTVTGKKVMQSSVDTLKRLTLELGGNDAGIVLPDVDPKEVAEKLLWAAYNNNGQTCACLKRLYVHDDIYDAICEEMVKVAKNIKVGDGLDEDNVLGPVQNEQQYRKVIELVEDARDNGGRVLIGGEPLEGPGFFYPVTLVADVTDGMRLVDEEQFGPATPIIRYNDIDEVITRANASDMGLGGSIWSADVAKARELALRLECGSVWVNNHGAIQPNAPFGGIKQSGFGVEFAEEGLREFTLGQTLFC
ncbi:aldehyde dehydrogenase family protein [Roseibium sp. SCP14]|uniref:aldehyde dehydrogenase family protein n=1 Tax=Roseibium sp. SCP14 TaxID=3141375 RepID=UPI00333D43CF